MHLFEQRNGLVNVRIREIDTIEDRDFTGFDAVHTLVFHFPVKKRKGGPQEEEEH